MRSCSLERDKNGDKRHSMRRQGNAMCSKESKMELDFQVFAMASNIEVKVRVSSLRIFGRKGGAHSRFIHHQPWGHTVGQEQ